MQVRRNGNVLVITRRSERKDGEPPETQVIARLRAQDPRIPDEVKKKLSPAELAEVNMSIKSAIRAEALKAEHAARTLPEQANLALIWFRDHSDAEGRAVAQEMLPTLSKLRSVVLKLAAESESE